MAKRGRGKPPQIRTEISKALQDERLTPRQRYEYILMLAELDGYEFKFKGAKTIEELPTEEEIFAKDSEKRIKEMFGVKEETHANTPSNSSGS